MFSKVLERYGIFVGSGDGVGVVGISVTDGEGVMVTDGSVGGSVGISGVSVGLAGIGEGVISGISGVISGFSDKVMVFGSGVGVPPCSGSVTVDSIADPDVTSAADVVLFTGRTDAIPIISEKIIPNFFLFILMPLIVCTVLSMVLVPS